MEKQSCRNHPGRLRTEQGYRAVVMEAWDLARQAKD